MSYRCHALSIEIDALTRYGRQLGLHSLDQALHALAQAIALHPMWQDLPQIALMVRSQPTPVIAIIGTLSPKSIGQIGIQQPSLNEACRRLRYIDYAAATAATEQLATQLVQRWGSRSIKTFSFYGIPRGGLIVLGLLAYALGLSTEQLHPPYPEDVPLVVVDDCALSGSRLATTLHQYPSHNLIFAPLYAHPDLRTAIVAAEPQILHCVSGQDLSDHGPTMLGAENYVQWQTENRERLSGQRYWLGLPDYLCFPWNEPDHPVWNPVTHQLEQGWRIMPPAYCLKNRQILPNPLPIQTQPQSKGWLQPSPDIIFGELGGQILMGHLATGETFGLSGRAAHFWQTLLQAEHLDGAIATLSRQEKGSQADLHRDLTQFLNQLQSQGLATFSPSVYPYPHLGAATQTATIEVGSSAMASI
ncbi:MAG: PqqD family protein [Thermosynechococcaceae cyanobacterium]